MYSNKKAITQLSYEIVGCAIRVHRELGPGLLESVYQRCMAYECRKHGFEIAEQMIVPVLYDNLHMDTELRLDMFVENRVVVEFKTVEIILPVHEAQLLTYMKLLKAPQGLLINFYTDNITKSARPFVNDYFKSLPD